jgi:hypothetical protein
MDKIRLPDSSTAEIWHDHQQKARQERVGGEQPGQIAFLHQTDAICGNASSPSPA